MDGARMKRKLSVSMMIYPADFKEQLLHIEDRCDDPVSFFDQDFVFCIVHVNSGELEEEFLWDTFVRHMNHQSHSIVVLDENECAATFKQIAEHRRNGLFIPEYAPWIVRLSSYVKSLSGG